MNQLTCRSLCKLSGEKRNDLVPQPPSLQIWLQRTFLWFQSSSLTWKDTVSTHLTRHRKIRRSCSPIRKKRSRKRSKVGRKVGSNVLLAKETTLKATNLNKLYLSTKFYNNSPIFNLSNLLCVHTGCPRRNVPDFGRVFLKLKYTDITQNTYGQSWTVTEIMAREKCCLLAGPRNVPASWQSYPCPSLTVVSYDGNSANARSKLQMYFLRGDNVEHVAAVLWMVGRLGVQSC